MDTVVMGCPSYEEIILIQIGDPAYHVKIREDKSTGPSGSFLMPAFG